MLEPNSRRPLRVEVTLHSGTPDSVTLLGRVLGVDRANDLAPLRVEAAKLPAPLKLASAGKLIETEDVYVFGFPFGREPGKNITVNKSSVSSLRKAGGVLKQVQVNGGMHPGNSGGPVTDAAGQVVGVAVSGLRGTTINFAVPGDAVLGFFNGYAHEIWRGAAYKDGGQIGQPVRVGLVDPLGRAGTGWRAAR
jgi:S1-C subfamily serine protease